jgi:hypothetical protein
VNIESFSATSAPLSDSPGHLPTQAAIGLGLFVLWALSLNVALAGAILGIIYVSMRFHQAWRAVLFGVISIGAPFVAMAAYNLFDSNYAPPYPWQLDWHAISGATLTIAIAVSTVATCAFLMRIQFRRGTNRSLSSAQALMRSCASADRSRHRSHR